ncbi:cell envelope integrity protein TolA [Massilia glaciei]|uniref:Cell envelope integrity protein TolA n=1 Tax=Massilia glaciei TaxID=1524097 RepID=A0A2U2HKE6_9BURK|nr:cell envelope integrity protein TolA [Massilia glaciei]
MTPASPNGAPYRVPPEPSRWPSIALAALVHAGLLLFLWIGVSWQNTEPVVIEAEVWDMKTQSAAPAPPPASEPVAEPLPPPEPVPEPIPEPVPEPVARPIEPPKEQPAAPKPPDIAIEKAKLKAEKLRLKELEEKQVKELAAKEKARELAEKKKLDDAKKAMLNKLAAAAKKATDDEADRLENARQNALKRMIGKASDTGSAAQSTASVIDKSYLADIRRKIKGETSYAGNTNVPSNPQAVFTLAQLPTGEILPGSVRMKKSSGVAAFDEAVENGIIKSSPLPKKKDGTVERNLVIAFSMKDLD